MHKLSFGNTVAAAARLCRAFALFSFVVCGSTMAAAQDALVVESPAIWSGFYAGVHGGWGKVHDTELKGIFGGVHAGYNHQVGGVVLGIEGDYSRTMIEYDRHYNHYFFGPVSLDAKLDYLASVRARMGVTSADRASMLFGTLGYAASEVSQHASAPNFNITEERSDVVHGIVAGVGLEYKLSSTLSGRVEANHYWVGEDGPTWDVRFLAVRAGLSIQLPSN